MKKLTVLSLFLVFFSASCGDMFKKTTYIYTPPKTKEGFACVQNCQFIYSNCAKTCREQKNVSNIINNVGSLLPSSHSSGTVDFGFKADVDEKNCSGSCLFDYNVCYVSCGGRVTEKISD